VLRRLPGYGSATPDTIQRRFLSTGGIILNRGPEIAVRLNGAATHPSSARPACPKRSPCPGRAAAPSVTNTTGSRTEGRFGWSDPR
jgi:hypothetical protein